MKTKTATALDKILLKHTYIHIYIYMKGLQRMNIT